MRVRFKRNVSSAAAGSLARLFEGQGLGMFDLIVKIEPFAGDVALSVSDDGANEWTGTDLSDAARRELQRASHHLPIVFGLIFQFGPMKSVPPALAGRLIDQPGVHLYSIR